MRFEFTCLGCSLALMVAVSPSWAGVPYPTRKVPAARDVGTLSSRNVAGDLTVTLPLKLRDSQAAEDLLANLSDQTSPSFHQFLTPAEFKARFAQSDADVAATVAHLAAYGLHAERAGASSLRVSGSPANLERAFHVSLHQYQVSAGASSYQFHAPTTAPTVPSEISAVVESVVGLSTRPQFSPHSVRSSGKLGKPQAAQSAQSASSGSTTGNAPGLWTVADLSKYYDVQPLAAKNVTGEGRTLAIVTLASFTPADAFAYWTAVGLKVNASRITVVDVDGGPGAPSDASGSEETTLDVEQSGGLAPGAKIIVYQAPNTNQAFLDAFVKAVEGNKADSISTSWGEWEWYDNLTNGAVTDAYSGDTVSSLQAFHEIFLQAAVQGQSLFAASGDSGAYDANDGATPPDYTLALSVDNPASDSFITAAGATTLAGTQSYTVPSGSYTVTIPHERVWGWDYLDGLCTALGYDPIACGIFPVGSGGGVSFEYRLPFYQYGIAGIQKTQPHQQFTDETTTPPQTLLSLPAYFAGRNVPDISFNGDPETGYVIYYTSDQSGFIIDTYIGGTSFVAPQLNGVTALIDQYVRGRVGLLNIPMYDLARRGSGYGGKNAPFNAIKYGNNEFYQGRDGYSPAVGIGTLDVANFADALKESFGKRERHDR